MNPTTEAQSPTTSVRCIQIPGLSARPKQIFKKTCSEKIPESTPVPDSATIEFSKEQNEALDLFKQGKNLFITGPGGTGKTLLIKEFIKQAYLADKEIQVCALTGCASLLLGKGARTIHSWSGIKLAKGPNQRVIDQALKNRLAKKAWTSTDILVIDEVSMMSHKILNILEELARRARRSSRPFGGIQVIFCGDFYQLGPVGDQAAEPETTEFCFQSPLWFQIFPLENHIQLHTIFRQTDQQYIQILNEIRQGTLSPENIRLLKNHKDRPPFTSTTHNDCYLTKLFPIRSRVDYINKLMFDKIQEPIKESNLIKNTNLTAYIETGKPFEDEVIELCNNLSHEDKLREIEKLTTSSNLLPVLQLKKGAAVMCVTNLDIDRGICNGSQGVIIDFVGPAPKVKFANGVIEVIPLHHIQSDEYPCISIAQYPLCFAWAMTIHKMQGATLDMAQIDIGSSIFDYGQTYVALSRIRNLDGLYLSEFNPMRIRANPKVQEFYQKISATTTTSATTQLSPPNQTLNKT
jgi:ATP-dependent DNA helicase PIF1